MDLSLLSLSHLYVVLLFVFLCCGCVPVMSLPNCVWSLWCRSHSIPTSGISLRWSDLLYVLPVRLLVCLVVLLRLDKSYVLVTNTNRILCISCSLMSSHCMPLFYRMLFCKANILSDNCVIAGLQRISTIHSYFPQNKTHFEDQKTSLKFWKLNTFTFFQYHSHICALERKPG